MLKHKHSVQIQWPPHHPQDAWQCTTDILLDKCRPLWDELDPVCSVCAVIVPNEQAMTGKHNCMVDMEE